VLGVLVLEQSLKLLQQEQMPATLCLQYALGHKADSPWVNVSADKTEAEQLPRLTFGLFGRFHVWSLSNEVR
jgi:hypothetical protein